jgi:hypothetical protein
MINDRESPKAPDIVMQDRLFIKKMMLCVYEIFEKEQKYQQF